MRHILFLLGLVFILTGCLGEENVQKQAAPDGKLASGLVEKQGIPLTRPFLLASPNAMMTCMFSIDSQKVMVYGPPSLWLPIMSAASAIELARLNQESCTLIGVMKDDKFHLNAIHASGFLIFLDSNNKPFTTQKHQ